MWRWNVDSGCGAAFLEPSATLLRTPHYQYGWKAGFRAGPAQGVVGWSASNLWFASASRAHRGPLGFFSLLIPYCAGDGLDKCTAWWIGRPPPQGPSLGSGLFCPGPSSLNAEDACAENAAVENG